MSNGRNENSGHKQGHLCVLLGPDGCGKSTLLNSIKKHRPELKRVSATPQDLYPLPDVPYMNWALETHPREYVKKLHPLTRSAFFAKTLAIEYEYHVKPALESGMVVVADSLHYRFVAKEEILNPSGASLLQPLLRAIPQPDLVIWIDLPFEQAYARKTSISSFEFLGQRDIDGFCELQRRVSLRIEALLEGVNQIRLDGTSHPQKLALSLIGELDLLSERDGG